MPCSSQRRGGYTIRCSGNWDFPAPEDDYDAARPWATYRTLAVSAADSPITLEVPAGTTLTYDADKVDGSNSSLAFITSYSGTLTVTGGGTLHAEGDNAYTILTDGHNVDAGHWVYDSNLTLQGVTIEILGGKNESAALPAIAAVHGTGTIVADGVTFRVVDEGCDLDTIGPGPIYQDSWPDAACSSRARAYRGSATGTFTDCVFVGGRSGGSVVYNFGSATFKDCTVSTPTEPLWFSSQYAEASGALRLSSRGTVMLDNLKLSVDESWSTAIHLSGDVAVTMTECDIPAGDPQVYLMDDATLTLTGGSTVACEIYVYGGSQDSSTVIVEDATVSGGNSGTGGIAGYLSDGDFAFERCANTGAVSNDAAGQAFLGGVVGYVSSAASTLTLTDCTNGGELSAPNATAGAAGGIVGQLDVAQSVTLTGCANTATVACPALPAVGGVAGACVHGDLIRCTNAAAVTGGNYAGGVAGRFGTGRLDRCAGGVGDVAAAKAAGRLVGLVSNGPKGMATFAIDDANGDAHSAALGSIGRVVDDTAGPAWGLATVEAGRLIGTPSLGNNTAAIRFAGPGKWAQKPGFLDYFAYPVLEGEAGHWQ